MGYLNNIEKVGNKYVRKPKVKFSFWDNETRVMKRLGFDIKVTDEGGLEREWIEGDLIKDLNPIQKQSLIDAIEKVHKVARHNITTQDWHAYDKHIDVLDQKTKNIFYELSKKYYGQDLVVSHNDINFHNMLWNGKEIILIDYEWANLNHAYFDYVQFYIAEGIKLRDDLDPIVWKELLILSLIYFILWSYEAPQEPEVLEWRSNYENMLRLYIK